MFFALDHFDPTRVDHVYAAPPWSERDGES